MEFIAVLLVAGSLTLYVRYRLWRGDGVSQAERDQVRLREGIVLMDRRLYNEAFAYFEQVLAREPRCAVALACRARCQLMLGNLYHTIADCNRAAGLDHNLDTIYLDKGVALFQLGHVRDAFVQFDKAVWYFNTHARPNAEAYRWRGVTRLKLGQYARAERDFRRAVDLGDEHAMYFLSMRGDSLDAVEVE
ncbi:MAG: tetratricopeptide repeat protein [Cytophagales bacterium]|jgi:tetratricopeptide (TPR) repeat protein|nr:tetratricopeptide repeat protein [Cytophagales bacterium]